MELVLSPTIIGYGIVKAVTILVGAYLISHLVKYILGHFINRLLQKTKTKVDDEITAASKKPIFWTIFLVGINYASASLVFFENFQSTISGALLSLAIVIWMSAGLNIVNIIFEELEVRLTKIGKSSDAIPFLKNLSKASLFLAAALVLLKVWGINITPILASAGVLGLAVAFAAKDTVANLFGGISVFFDKPYKIGDYIILEDKYRGEVIKIGMRSTKIRTRDNVLLSVPNSVMVTNAVINETGFDPKLRIRIPMGVSYDDDLEKIEKVLVKVMKKHNNVVKSPSPRVRYRSFADSSITLDAMAVIEAPALRGITIHEIIKDVHKTLKKEGIELPYPQQEIYLHKR
ncbi:MAG: mechanosensitive ion channel family protein [Candidatus Woesebacteria bacterium]|jgi:small-conductance mechanosensitive channel